MEVAMVEKKKKVKWTVREQLLADILPAIDQAHSEENFAESLEIALKSNADLRNKILQFRKDPMIAKKQIIGNLPDYAKKTVKCFIREILETGNRCH